MILTILALLALIGLTYWLSPWFLAVMADRLNTKDIPLTPEQLLEIRKANTLRRLHKNHPGARYITPEDHATDVAVRHTAKKLGLSRRVVRQKLGLA